MSGLTLGSLFSGFGGLDRAIENVFGARTAWVSDIEPGPCKVLAHRFPHAPNLGDITKVDWTQVEPVDIIAGGSPCQDISSAGRMAGMREGTRSNLWVEMRDAIATLHPRYVVWENVSNARSAPAASAMESDPRLLGDGNPGQPVLRALGRVLGDLAGLGFDAEWVSVRASDIDAPHPRKRVFALASHPDRQGLQERRDHGEFPEAVSEARAAAGGGSGLRFGRFGEAVCWWERRLGRVAPEPMNVGPGGRPKLNPLFAEWMMGTPAGWITDVPGVTDNEALRMAGNGVVQLQAEAALRIMLARMEAAA